MMKKYVGLLLLCAAFCVPAAFAQNSGQPNFGAEDCHSVDCINLQDLTPVVTIPFMNKSGAFPLSLSATGNFYITQVSGTWTPGIETSPFFTVEVNGMISPDGYVSANPTGALPVTCPIADGTGSATEYMGWYIEFPDGTKHPLPATDLSYTGATCSGGFTDQAMDDSGYTLSVTGLTVNSIYTSGGVLITTSSIKDSNGNTITQSGDSTTDTLGLVAVTSDLTSNPETFSWTDVNGGSPEIKLTNTSYTLRTAFSSGTGTCASGTDYDVASQALPTLVTFPDTSTLGLSYEATPGFASDRTGRLAEITLRQGGTIQYAYSGGSNGINCAYFIPPTMTRTTTDGTTTYTTFFALHSGTNYYETTTVIDPGGNKKVYTFTGLTETGNAPLPVAQVVTQLQTYQNTGTVGSPVYSLLATDTYCYNAKSGQPGNCSTAVVSYPITEVDVYHNIGVAAGSSRTQTLYDGFGNVTSASQYDFGGTSPTFKTNITYGTLSGGSCVALGNHINNKPCSVVSWQGTPVVSWSEFAYDAHGNLLTRYVSSNGGSTFLSNPTANVYNANGTISKSYDLSGNLTSFGYGSGCDNALPTSITYPNSSTAEIKTWNCPGGVLLTDKDQNGNTTTIGYQDVGGVADPFWRRRSVTDPLGNEVWTLYHPETCCGVGDTETTFAFGSSTNTTYIGVDGYGRFIASQHAQSPSGSDYDTVTQSYAWLTSGGGFQVSSSIPCSEPSGSPCTTGIGTSSVDVLNRFTGSADAGGGSLAAIYTQNDVLSALYPAPSGENLKKVQNEFDGLNRLTSSCKISSTVPGNASCNQNTNTSYKGIVTTTAYSAATGSSTAASTRGSQTRTTVVDGMGRPKSIATPEGGTVTNVYDSSSFCGSSFPHPGKLILTTFANGNFVCFLYDSLGRNTEQLGGYSGGAWTQCHHFAYDSTANEILSVPSGATINNVVGRLMEGETDNCASTPTTYTDEWFSYDKDGHQTDMWEKTPNSGQYYHSTATFFGNGAIDVLTLVSHYGLTYGIDGEGRPNSLEEGSTVVVPASGVSYNAASQPLTINIGTGTDNDTYTYDSNTGRMKTWSFGVGAAYQTGTLTWNDNWTLNKLVITDGFNAGGAQTCNMNPSVSTGTGYDDLSRLVGTNCGAIWGQLDSYDQYDNNTKSIPSGSAGINFAPGYVATSNHLASSSGALYDASGNMTKDPSATSYTWDPFNKMLSAGSNTLVSDAFGRTVEIDNGSTSTEIWYTQVGKTAFMNGATEQYAYWPAPGGGTVAFNGSDYYMHKDWMGNARIMSRLSGAVTADQAFGAYGEIYDSFGAPPQNQNMFAGLTQDILAGMNDTPNRELQTSSQGRFLSPDPAGQGWNQYGWPTNPNSFSDPSGLEPKHEPSGCSPLVGCTIGAPQPSGDGGPFGYGDLDVLAAFGTLDLVLIADGVGNLPPGGTVVADVPASSSIGSGTGSCGGGIGDGSCGGPNFNGSDDYLNSLGAPGDPLMNYLPPTTADWIVTVGFLGATGYGAFVGTIVDEMMLAYGAEEAAGAANPAIVTSVSQVSQVAYSGATMNFDTGMAILTRINVQGTAEAIMGAANPIIAYSTQASGYSTMEDVGTTAALLAISATEAAILVVFGWLYGESDGASSTW